jgi:hypothetical protein
VTLIVQLAALLMLLIALAVWLGRVPSARRRRVSPRARPRGGTPGDLEAIAESVAAARASAADVHRRVRPLLREIAAARLARRGIGLDRDPLQARAVLGEELWEIVRSDRPAPAARDESGMSVAAIAQLTDRLEAV